MSQSLTLLSITATAFILLGFPSTVMGDTPNRRPNILVIYSDDHGWADIGIQGADKNIRTPHLDRLAGDGVRFVRGYVTAPQCVPSRAGVITGRYQQRFGVEDNNKGPLPPEETTLAERLKAVGYATGMVGKWHLDIGAEKGQAKANRIERDSMPHRQGFEEYFRGEMKQFYASHDLAGSPLANAPQLFSDSRCRVVVQTEAALSFLERRTSQPDQPWFLYLGWYAPHVPLESPEPWYSQTPSDLPIERRQALAMIAAMDDGLGKIREQLRKMQADKDTLIFFVGDNGAPLKSGAWNGSLNAPLVGEKGMLTDGGVRTPFLAAWPDHLPAGLTYEHPVSSLDIAATSVALSGAADKQELDGTNLMPYLDGRRKESPHQFLYWRWRSQAAVLEYPWKLIRLGKDHTYLFDLSSEGGETRNLAAEHPDKVKHLAVELDRWSQGLKPAGAAESDNPQDNLFFAAHVDKSLEGTLAKKTTDKGSSTSSDSVQGWICRNGELSIGDHGLHVAVNAEATKGRAFITNSNLNLPGPITVQLRCRTSKAGLAAITWRTKQRSFEPNQSAEFRWTGDEAIQDVKVSIPEEENVIHVRIQLPAGAAFADVESITISDRNGKKHAWNFVPK